MTTPLFPPLNAGFGVPLAAASLKKFGDRFQFGAELCEPGRVRLYGESGHEFGLTVPQLGERVG